MTGNEQKLLRRAKQGDTAAFGELVEMYQGQVYRLALHMGLSPDDAEETAQEAFLAAWRGLPRFRGESRFSTWLYTLTTHAAVDVLRREKKYRGNTDIDGMNLPDTAPTPQETAERRETREAVRAALQTLSPQAREILLLRYQAELDYAAIGKALRLSSGTVKSRLNRAKAQLRTILSAQGNFFSSGAVQKEGEEERT